VGVRVDPQRVMGMVMPLYASKDTDRIPDTDTFGT